MKEAKKEKKILFQKLTAKEETTVKGGGEVPYMKGICANPPGESALNC
ncbi:MAG: hypothetical protein GY757_48675 [bacterium]|nr:hypothetical protein [bacterium]